MLYFLKSPHRDYVLSEKFLCRWNGNFFFILSLYGTLLILGIDRIKECAVPVQTAFVSGLYLILGVLMIPVIKYLSGFKSNAQNCDDRLNENRERFLVSMVIMIMAGFLLLTRAVTGILMPFDRAQDYYEEDRVVNGLVESFIPEEDSEAVFSNGYLAGIADQPASPEPGYQTILLCTGDGLVCFYCKAENLEYGDRIEVNLHFTRPSPARNPGGFDEKQYYYSNGIYLKDSQRTAK